MPLDIGVGIVLAVAASAWFHIPLSLFLILFSIGAALFPDIDIVTKLFGEWKHRGITHYPIVYVPISLLLFAFVPLPYALIFTVAVCAHLIHDTIGIGWGIAWLWPISGRKFLIFPDRARRRVLGTFVTWKGEDDEKVRNMHYEGASEDWVRDFYFRPNPIAYIEYGAFLLSILTLILYIW